MGLTRRTTILLLLITNIVSSQIFNSDTLVHDYLKRYDVPSAILSYVDKDTTITKSFGSTTNRELKKPNIDNSLYQIASIGKVFTAIAAIKCITDNKLSFNDKVTTYLPEFNFLEDVTIHQLLTHSAGIEERIIGYKSSSNQTIDLEEYLVNRMPTSSFVQERAKIPIYSNHGYALLGLLVQKIVNIPFYEYVQKNILNPLSMDNSGYITPKNVTKKKLVPNFWASGAQVEFKYSNPYPAGSFAVTATDMSKFIEALLNDANTIITPEIKTYLFGEQFKFNQTFSGYSYGFNIDKVQGKSIYIKSGSAPAHSATLLIDFTSKKGVFTAINRQEPTLCVDIAKTILEVNTNPFNLDDKQRIEDCNECGTYRIVRYSKKSIEKIYSLFLDINIKQIDEYKIELYPEQSSIGVKRDTFYKVQPLVYRNKENKLLSFNNQFGKVNHGFIDIDSEHFSFEKISFFKSSKFIFPLLGIIVIGYLVVILFLGIKVMLHKFRNKTKVKTSFIFLNAILALIYLTSFFLTVGDFNGVSIDIPSSLYIIQTLPLVFIVLFGFLFYKFIKMKRNLSPIEKGVSVVTIVLGMLVIFFCFNFNLIGYNF